MRGCLARSFSERYFAPWETLVCSRASIACFPDEFTPSQFTGSVRTGQCLRQPCASRNMHIILRVLTDFARGKFCP